MPLISSSPIGLSLEDFRRLGVRPHEYRLAVIRRAAMQSAKSLAEKQLTSPSEQVGLQLSRVATSAYRLLDPRRRRDVTQRVHVGRILPNALNWAGHTSFQSELTPTSDAAPFGRESLSDAELFELFELDTSPPAPEDGDSWETGQGQDDLLFDFAPLNRRSARFRSRFRLPWILLSTVGLAIGAVLGLVTLRARQNELRLRRVNESRADATLPAKTLALDTSTPAVNGSDLASPVPSEPPARIADPLLPSKAESRKTDGFLSDPFTARALTEIPPEMADIKIPELSPPSAKEASLSEDVADGAPIPAVTRHVMPDEASLRAARTQLMLLVPQLAQTVAVKEVASRIAEIEAVERDLPVGTADYWEARLLVAELAWLIEDVVQVSQRLKSIVENYDVALQQPLSESFVAACGDARLPETHQHLLTSGLTLADQLLMSESFADCRSVIEAMGRSAELLESESSLGYVEQYSQAIDQMERLAESSNRIIDDAGEVHGDSREVGIVGRYYCLMLRRWDVGLPWLTEASDPRIAGIARQEIELGGAGSAEESIALSQRWLAAAARTSGHAADSMRLHAIDLLREAQAKTRGLKKLTMERMIDEAEQLLPPFLRFASPAPQSAVTSGAAPATSGAPPTKTSSDGDVMLEVKNGLSGRIKMDQQDIGVQLDYELDVPLTQKMLDTIAERLNRTITSMSIEMVGEFELKEPATVLVSIATSQQGSSQQVELDGALVEVDPLDGAAKVSLNPGRHEITWTIDSSGLSREFLSLHDAATGRRVQVVQPAGARRPAALTVAMVRDAR